MKLLKCSQCGAYLTKDENGEYYCEHCGSRFKEKPEVKKEVIEPKFEYFEFEEHFPTFSIPKPKTHAPKKAVVLLLTCLAALVISLCVYLGLRTPTSTPSEEISGNAPILQSVNLTYSIDSSKGCLEINGSKYFSYSCTLYKGEEINVKVIPNEHFSFKNWNLGVNNVNRTDKFDNYPSTQSKELTFEYVAYLVEDPYITLEYSALIGGTIQGNCVQKLYEGDAPTAITAVPVAGYTFTKWSDGVTSATRHDTDKTSNLKVQAYFLRLFANGTGTKVDPYIVTDGNDFVLMSSYDASNIYFKLSNDIVVDESKYGFNFCGNLDGANHTISGQTSYLFYNLHSATIENLKIDVDSWKFNPLNNDGYNGVLARTISGTTSIYNCEILRLAIMTSTKKSELFVGGIAGKILKNSNVSIESCSSDIYLNGMPSGSNGKLYFGGLVGYVEHSCVISIKNSSTKLEPIVGSLSNCKVYVGGLVGLSYTNSSSITLENNTSILDIVVPVTQQSHTINY